MHVRGVLFFDNRRKIPDEKFRNIFQILAISNLQILCLRKVRLWVNFIHVHNVNARIISVHYTVVEYFVRRPGQV